MPKEPLPPPDWDRFAVHSRAVDTTGQSYTPLGDPTKWGGQTTAILPAGTGGFVNSDQFIRVQATDHYSRAWGLVGVLSAPASLFALPNPFHHAVVPAQYFGAQLLVTMGVGQTTVVHRFDLRAIIANAEPFYAPDVTPVTPGVALINAPFVISGGLIGQALSMGAAYNYTVAVAIPATAIHIKGQLSPFAAGTGL